MKIYKKKYAIYGMIEQSSVFPMGTGHVRVDFRHGSLTTAGIVPATYTTSNPVIQQAIENSPKFKARIIKDFLLHTENDTQFGFRTHFT